MTIKSQESQRSCLSKPSRMLFLAFLLAGKLSFADDAKENVNVVGPESSFLQLLSSIRLKQESLTAIDWNAVAAIAAVLTCLLTALTLLTIWLARKSIVQSVLSRDANSLIWAVERMEKVKNEMELIRNAPSYKVLDKTSDSSVESEWDNAVLGAAHKISVELQRLSYMANAGMISRVHLQKMWGPTFVEAWDLLQGWIYRLRVERGEPIQLVRGKFSSRRDFEEFASYCRKAAKN